MKEKIIDATIDVFNDKGLKFTMDDVAKSLSVSKKTLYKVFPDKEALIYEMVRYCFDSIKAAERETIMDESLDIVDKIGKVIIILPDRFKNIDLSKLYELKDKYPDTYAMVAERLENDWQPTINLIEMGMREGRIKQVDISILKTMVEATIEKFMQDTVLIDNGLSYEEGLEKMMDIIMQGIVVEP